MTLKNIFSELTESLDKLDLDREEILKISRIIIRDCSIAIKSIHREEFDQYKVKIQSVKNNHEKLTRLVNKTPGIFYKYLKTPEQEYAEAVAFYTIILKKALPTPSEMKIDPLNFALGLADVIGELRRYALDNIRNSQVEDLNEILENMDDIYSNLFSLDYPSGLTQDLRQKTDRARLIIEKTRGDISISLQMNDLKRCIQDNVKED
jgi:translin